MSPPSSIPAKRVLASKEATLFRELLTLYETKQLKKALKTADQILKKVPEHGETLCMKGLLLTHMGKREEGMELVKKGIRLDLTSHICWHVFGLIQKGEKKYEEALKSYTQALKFDKENINILRDTAHLQTQLRAFDGLVETRLTLLRTRPNIRQHWLALAVAYHLSGNLSDANQIMNHYRDILKGVKGYDVEHAQTILYHVRILEELGELSEALNLLDSNSKNGVIMDRTVTLEARARILSKMESKEAEDAWRVLIERNPDCLEYYRGYLAAQGFDFDIITDETRPQALKILERLRVEIPRSSTPLRLALDLAIGDQFTRLAEEYLILGLRKGISSLFSDVKSLYADPHKQESIESIMERIRDTLVSGAPLRILPNPDIIDPAASPMSNEPTEDPTTYLWTLYFLAQHYTFLNKLTHALSILSVALKHTPTLPELYTCGARILKRAGDPLGAAKCLEEARLLDGQDRYLNTKCAKYRFRAGLVEEANQVLGLFTRAGISPGADLETMQCLLYFREEGDAHFRARRLGLALKRYHAVQKIFDEIEDDQFDFHSYSIRTFNINPYLNLLSWEDQLRNHRDYVAAAVGAAKIYVALFQLRGGDDDDPHASATSSSSITPASLLGYQPVMASAPSSPSAVGDAAKKAKKKAKKAAAKGQGQDDRKPAPNASEDKGLEPAPAKDDDPDGSKLLSVSDPLEQAAKLLRPFNTLQIEDGMDVWLMMYDVAVRRKKFLQAIKALNHIRSLKPDHPALHVRAIHFHTVVSSLPETPPSPVGPILTDWFSAVFPAEVSLDTYNSQYLQAHSTCGAAILGAAQASFFLDDSVEQIEATLFGILNPDVQLTLHTAGTAVATLKEMESSRVDELRAGLNARFPLSTVFKLPTQLAVHHNTISPEIEGEVDEVGLGAF